MIAPITADVGATDKSIPPEMIISVIPSAMAALIDHCCRMLIRFGAAKNTGDSEAKTTTIKISPKSVPASRRLSFGVKGTPVWRLVLRSWGVLWSVRPGPQAETWFLRGIACAAMASSVIWSEAKRKKRALIKIASTACFSAPQT